jgi:ribonuclease J
MLITPKLREHLNGIAQTLLVDPFPDSTLTRFEKEILATAVSASNNCFYCMDCHAEFAIAVCELEKNSEEAEEITESIKTGSTDKLSEKMQKLVIIAKNVKELARNYEKEKKDVEAALKAGATAGDVQLAVAIAAAFCMYNRFVEGFRAQTFDSFAIYKERAKIIAKDEMRKTKGKFIMTTFSSNISRIRQCVEAAVKFNRKIIFLGRSMRENTRLANEIGYLPIPQSLMGKDDEVMKLPPQKVCLIVAGSQGQYDSALSKLSQNQNKFIKIKPGDKVVFSSDPVPGNETGVYALIEELVMMGAEVIYTDIKEQLHASGHGNQEDLKLLARMANPKYFIPIGGTIRHQRAYRDLIGDLGFNEKTVFLLDEGETIWFEKNKAYPGDPIITKNIYVDAYGIGDVGTVVLRDRKALAAEGIVMAVLILDKKGNQVTRPVMLSKGFVFEKGEEKLFDNAVTVMERVLKPQQGQSLLDPSSLKKHLVSNLENFFYKERGREPLIIVEVVQV